MKPFLEPQVYRPSLLRSRRDPKTRLFSLNAAPVLREGRLISDNSMPAKDWTQFDEPACRRFKSRPYAAPIHRLSILQAG